MTWRDLVERLRSSMFLGLKDPRPLPSAPSGVSRRQFLKVAGIAAATIALLPDTLALDEPLVLEEFAAGISLADVDALLTRIYAPLIMEMLNADNMLLRFMTKDDSPLTDSFVVPIKVGRNYYTGSRR
jgi:hypothetical protein